MNDRRIKENTMIPIYAVSVGIADIRRNPDPNSELVTQALMNALVSGGETAGEWTHVTLSDYKGWIHSHELDESVVKGKAGEHYATPLDLVAIVTATHTPLYTQSMGDETLDTVYLSTVLPLLDTTQPERLHVALPGRRSAWLLRNDVDIRQRERVYPREPIAAITTRARAFLNVPYLWGGISWQGIDCSGLVQLCYRTGGYIIPRDADQQYDALAHSITRTELQEGDLIFFGENSITHVAIALSSKEYIHAEGQSYNCVTINSFDPTDAHYYQQLDELVWGIRRVIG